MPHRTAALNVVAIQAKETPMTNRQADLLEMTIGDLNHLLTTELTPHESTQIIQAISCLTYAKDGRKVDDD